MKSLLFLILFVVSLFSSLAYATSPKHLVILVHGIAAGPNTFGQMEKALLRESRSLGNGINYQVSSFSYETGNYNKNVDIFARELGDYIVKKFDESGGLHPEDRFSLVMHSQGGLVGFNFLLNTYLNHPDFHPELRGHIDAFITLATPYWGSKIAVFASRIIPILSYLNIPFIEDLIERFGKEELKDMGLASDYGAEMRKALINFENRGVIEQIKKDTRFLVFSGVTERLNFLAPISTGKNRYEDDTAVPIPSSRLDFLYYVETGAYHTENIGVESFKETNIINKDAYAVVSAFHSSPFPQSTRYPGIAKVPDRCADVIFRDCSHPSYPSVVQHLFGLARDAVFERDLMSFAIDLKINTKGESIDRKKMSIGFKALTLGLTIGKEGELYNRIGRWSDEGDYRLYHTGYIDSKKTSHPVGKVEMTLSLPGFKTRKITMPVKSTYSTYVEIDLERE